MKIKQLTVYFPDATESFLVGSDGVIKITEWVEGGIQSFVVYKKDRRISFDGNLGYKTIILENE